MNINFFLKKSTFIYFLLCLCIRSFAHDDSNDTLRQLINQNNQISDPQKKYFIQRLFELNDKQALKRTIRNVIYINIDQLYGLTNDLPLAAKLISLTYQKLFEVIPVSDYEFSGNDYMDLRGSIYQLYNQKKVTLFYAEGEAKFLGVFHSFYGSMFVKYHYFNDQTVYFEAEVLISPNNPLSRMILKMLMNLGFGGYADKKIMNLYNKINRTAIRLYESPEVFIYRMNNKKLRDKLKISNRDRNRILDYISKFR